MRQARALAKLFEVSYGALFRNLDGITPEESLVYPKPAGNCVNWVLGHIVASRNRVLPLIDVPAIWSLEASFLYSGIEEAEWSVEKAAPFRDIQADLARTQQDLLSGLEDLRNDKLATVLSENRTIGDALGFLLFHESYHGGQIALLRRLLGKEGAIQAPKRRRRRSDSFSRQT